MGGTDLLVFTYATELEQHVKAIHRTLNTECNQRLLCCDLQQQLAGNTLLLEAWHITAAVRQCLVHSFKRPKLSDWSVNSEWHTPSARSYT